MNKRLLVTAAILILGVSGQSHAGLIAFYDFEGDANDRSGNGLHGVINGSVALVSGFDGQAYDFAGTASDFIQLPFGINPADYPNLTMGAWVNTDTSSVTGSSAPKVIGNDNGGFDRTLGMDFRSGTISQSTNSWAAFAGNKGVLRSGQPVNVGQWVFLAAVYNQSAATVTLYVNDQIASIGGASLGSSLLNATIGKNAGFGSNEAWNGMIDNVFLFDEALTSNQIEAIRTNPDSLYPSQATVPEPTSFAVFAFGVGGVVVSRRAKRRK